MISLALIGCGRIGSMHLELILSHFPDVHVRAIIDDNLATKGHFREIATYPNASLESVLSDEAIDAVLIATPSSTHCALIKQAFAHGKAVFCEKPVSFDRQALNDIIDLSHENKLQVGLNRRWDPDFLLLKQKIEQRSLGKLHIVKITNRDPERPNIKFVKNSGGLFLDFNIHDFDMASFLCDDKIESVYANGEALIQEELRRLGDIDTAIITLKMRQGTLVVIDSSRETGHGYDQRIEVFGEKGSLQVDNIPEHHSHYTINHQVVSAPPKKSFIERYKDAYINQLRAFFDYVISDESATSPVSAQDIQHALDVALAAKQSLNTKCIIQVNGS